MLSEVKIDKKKIEAYERSEPAILLRNVASSAVVEFPKRDVDFTEVNFGAQKVEMGLHYCYLIFTFCALEHV